MIKNIIFDFGGVILKHSQSISEEIISQIFSIPINQAKDIWSKEKILLMSGEDTSRQFLGKLKTELGSDKPVDDILALWKNLYVKEAEGVNWELLKFIEKLKNNYNIYLFTDTIDIHDEYNSSRGIYEKFSKVFKSNEEGYTKYHDDAFLNLLSKINAKPTECVFIDDLEINVKRAETLGITSILYKNKENLIQELSKLGINKC